MAKKEVAFKVVVDTSQVDDNIKKTTKSVDELGKKTKKTSNEMKAGFKSSSESAKDLGGKLGGAAGGAVNFATGIKSMTRAAIAFLATPLGAVIGAIGLAVATLTSYFKASEEGQQRLRVVSAALSAVFDNMTDVLANLGEALIQVFSGDFSGAMETAKNSFNSLGTEIVKDTKAAIELQKAMNALMVSERELGVERAKVLKQVAEARLAAEDETKSAEERVAALKQAATLESELAAREQENAEEKLRILREQAELNKSDEETLKAVADAEAEVYRVQLSSLNLNRRLKTEINSLEREIETERQQRATAEADRIKKLTEEQRKAEEEKLKVIEEAAEAEADLRRQIKDAQNELIQSEEEQLIAKAQTDLENRLAKIEGDSELELELRKSLEEVTGVEIQAIRDKFAAEREAKDKQSKDNQLKEEEKFANARINAARNVGNLLGAIGDLMAQQGQENTAAAKTLAVAQILIDTAVSIAGAIRTATQGSATPWDMIAGIAAGIAAVVAGIASATQILNSANVGGANAPAPNVSPAVTAAQPPQGMQVTTNTTELGNTEQAELAPIQAYVVETQITGNQENINQIEGQAEFGG